MIGSKLNKPDLLQKFFQLLVPALFLASVTGGASQDAGAQVINLASGDKSKPIEIFADDGIEWQRGNEVLIAQGNAKAVRGNVSVSAQVLRAFYQKSPGGGSDLSRLDAEGGVKIATPTDTLTGRAAVYDLQKAILIVTGKKVRYRMGNDVISANQQMEYYENKLMAVARGGATASHEGKTIRSDILTAYFRKDKAEKSKIFRVQAFDRVLIVTLQDTVRADQGIYDIDSGIATLTGNVRITRGQNQLTGDQAEINLNAGVSRLLTKPGRKKKKRVSGILSPHRP